MWTIPAVLRTAGFWSRVLATHAPLRRGGTPPWRRRARRSRLPAHPLLTLSPRGRGDWLRLRVGNDRERFGVRRGALCRGRRRTRTRRAPLTRSRRASRLRRRVRDQEHTSELQSPVHLVCRLLLEK